MTDAAVLMPEAFNEQFTVYLDAAGKPVQRALREMTAGEVLAAIGWHAGEAERLERETKPWAALSEAVEAGGDIPDDIADDELERAAAAIGRAGEAHAKTARLIRLVLTSIPRGTRLTFGTAVHKFWPR